MSDAMNRTVRIPLVVPPLVGIVVGSVCVQRPLLHPGQAPRQPEQAVPLVAENCLRNIAD